MWLPGMTSIIFDISTLRYFSTARRTASTFINIKSDYFNRYQLCVSELGRVQ